MNEGKDTQELTELNQQIAAQPDTIDKAALADAAVKFLSNDDLNEACKRAGLWFTDAKQLPSPPPTEFSVEDDVIDAEFDKVEPEEVTPNNVTSISTGRDFHKSTE